MTRRPLTAIWVAGLMLSGMTFQYVHAATEPPKTYLRDGDRRLQRGKLGSYCWVSGDQGVCVDSLPSWPKAARVEADDKLRMRFRKKQKPTKLLLTTYKKVKKNGIPKGQGRHLDRRLKRVRNAGETIGWKAIFTLERSGRHYYISAFARWDEGDASYFFHARTRWA